MSRNMTADDWHVGQEVVAIRKYGENRRGMVKKVARAYLYVYAPYSESTPADLTTEQSGHPKRWEKFRIDDGYDPTGYGERVVSHEVYAEEQEQAARGQEFLTLMRALGGEYRWLSRLSAEDQETVIAGMRRARDRREQERAR